LPFTSLDPRTLSLPAAGGGDDGENGVRKYFKPPRHQGTKFLKEKTKHKHQYRAKCVFIRVYWWFTKILFLGVLVSWWFDFFLFK